MGTGVVCGYQNICVGSKFEGLLAVTYQSPSARAPAASPRKEKIPKDANTATCSRGSLWSEGGGSQATVTVRLPDQTLSHTIQPLFTAQAYQVAVGPAGGRAWGERGCLPEALSPGASVAVPQLASPSAKALNGSETWKRTLHTGWRWKTGSARGGQGLAWTWGEPRRWKLKG